MQVFWEESICLHDLLVTLVQNLFSVEAFCTSLRVTLNTDS